MAKSLAIPAARAGNGDPDLQIPPENTGEAVLELPLSGADATSLSMRPSDSTAASPVFLERVRDGRGSREDDIL